MTSTTLIPAADRVAAGIAVLDVAWRYTGWRQDINLARFDINSWTACVLGQVYGNYGEGADTLWPLVPFRSQNDQAFEHGFMAANDGHDVADSEALQSAWLLALTEGEVA